jgi:hypothetical protein
LSCVVKYKQRITPLGRKELYEDRKQNFDSRAVYRPRDYVGIVYFVGNVAAYHANVVSRAAKGHGGTEETDRRFAGKSELVRGAAGGAP